MNPRISIVWPGILALLMVAARSYSATSVIIPANAPYTDTGLEPPKGQPLRIIATGEIVTAPPCYRGRDGFEWRVGPRGTYWYSKAVRDGIFPLAAAERGPAPCFCLIGKFGETGEPFYVGSDRCIPSSPGGKLYLGVNGIDFSRMSGAFRAEIAAGGEATPPEAPRDDVVFSAGDLPSGAPVPGASVVLIYVDGLRDDVLREMAESGHLPVIKQLFFDGGAAFACAFTGFPSSTLASNGTIFTGVFPNRSGIKGNNFFDRRTLKGDTYLQPFGPPAAADALRPVGLRRLWLFMKKGALSFSRSARERCRRETSADVPLLEDYVRDAGMACYSSILPVLPSSPPPRYEVDAATVIPPFNFHHAVDYLDRVTARYSKDLVIQPDARLMQFWFPTLDSVCHDSPRAQFGNGRLPLYLLDRRVGEIAAELKRKKMWDRTYLILFADHGTAGGKDTLIQKFDIARDFFHKPLSFAGGAMSPESGMGCSVRWYDDGLKAAGRKKRSFAFVDLGEGESRVYLPYGDIDSGDWLRRNTLAELFNYRVSPEAPPVNLIERLLAIDVGAQNLYPEKVGGRPVAQILVKTGENQAAVFGQGGAQAIVERAPDGENAFRYRYLPARNIACPPEGRMTFEETSDKDPFGYIDARIEPSWCREFHTEREWLEKTMYHRFPDAVVAVANQMFWDGRMAKKEQRFSPDMVLCASPGWSFEAPEHPSGAHGYLDYQTMHLPLRITGPNVRKGIVLGDPARVADIAPTVLSLIGVPYDAGRFDGKALGGFLDNAGSGRTPPGGGSAKALLARLPYAAEEIDRSDIIADYERRAAEKKPSFLIPDLRYKGHDYKRATDIHNVVADLFGIFNREVFADLDNLIGLATYGEKKRPVEKSLDAIVSGYDRLPDRYPKERMRELLWALQIREFTLGEAPPVIFMSVTGLASRGVAFRAELLLRWMEHMLSDMDYALLYPLRDRKIRAVSNMNYLLEGARITLEKVSWGLAHYVGKAIYDGIYHVEKANEKAVRAAKGEG